MDMDGDDTLPDLSRKVKEMVGNYCASKGVRVEVRTLYLHPTAESPAVREFKRALGRL